MGLRLTENTQVFWAAEDPKKKNQKKAALPAPSQNLQGAQREA
jgi:hypothetical protein